MKKFNIFAFCMYFLPENLKKKQQHSLIKIRLSSEQQLK